MTTNTEIKTWKQRMLNPSSSDWANAMEEEIAELRAALASTAAELEEWRFTNRIDELQRENDRLRASQQGAGELPQDAVLPCPFCGSAAHVEYDRMGLATNGRVHCVAMDCRADVWSLGGKDAAIAMWNRRAQRAASVPAEAVQQPAVIDVSQLRRYGAYYNSMVPMPKGNYVHIDHVTALLAALAPAAGVQPNRELMTLLDMVENDDVHDIMAMAAMRIKRLQAATVPQDIGRDAALAEAIERGASLRPSKIQLSDGPKTSKWLMYEPKTESCDGGDWVRYWSCGSHTYMTGRVSTEGCELIEATISAILAATPPANVAQAAPQMTEKT